MLYPTHFHDQKVKILDAIGLEMGCQKGQNEVIFHDAVKITNFELFFFSNFLHVQKPTKITYRKKNSKKIWAENGPN